MHLIFYYCHFVKAVEIEFSEESVTEYQHRDKLKEVNVLEWIAKVIMEPLQVKSVTVCERKQFHFNFKGAVQIDFFLRDGVRICQLMNKIKENSINRQEIITGNIDAHRANIQAFIKAARTYGVPDKYLFEAGDKIFKFRLMNPPGPL